MAMKSTSMKNTSMKNTKMTDSQGRQIQPIRHDAGMPPRAGRGNAARPQKRHDLIWKNALLATSLGATLLGWGWIASADTAAAQSTAMVSQSAQSDSLAQSIDQPIGQPVDQWRQPEVSIQQPSSGSDGVIANSLIPQQRRLFRRPITRTRHS